MTVKRAGDISFAAMAADLDPSRRARAATQDPAGALRQEVAVATAALERQATPLVDRMEIASERPTPVAGQSTTASPRPPSGALSIDSLEGQAEGTKWLRDMASKIQLRVGRQSAGHDSDIKLGAVLAGPDGVGKRYAASIYAKLLHDHKAIKDPRVDVIDLRLLLEDGDDLGQRLQQIKGGVVLFENAHCLDPQKNKADLRLIADLAAKNAEPVVLLSGGPELRALVDRSWRLAEHMQTQVAFSYLPAEVLTKVFVATAEQKGFVVTDEVRTAVFGRLRSAGRHGTKAVSDLLRQAQGQMAKRLFPNGQPPEKPHGQAELATFKPEDLKADSPFDASGELKAMKRLDECMIGQAELKAWAAALVNKVVRDLERQADGKKITAMNLNTIIKGPPGTGKTTVVELLNDILTQLGIRNGKIVYRTASDLKGSVRGEAEKLVRLAHEEARGGLLVIDEAHNLEGDEFGRKVIEALVPLSWNHRETTSVFLLGYSGPMDKMLNVDGGMRRRFPKQNVISTQKFSRTELGEILQKYVAKCEYKLAPGAFEHAIQILDVRRNGKDFGEAGDVENLVQEAINRQASRKCKAGEEDFLVAEDFGPLPESVDVALARLDRFVGFDHIRAQLEGIADAFKDVRKDNGDVTQVFEPYTCIVGPRGSGRTSLSDVLPQIYHAFGVIGPEVVVENALNFKAQFQGQTYGKVKDKLESALGGTFVLKGLSGLTNTKDTYATEAIEALKDVLKDNRGRLAVIFMGTQEEVGAFLALDPELAKLIDDKFVLKPMSAADAATLFEREIGKAKRELDDEALNLLPGIMEQLASLPGWAGGHDVGKLARRVQTEHSTARRLQKYADRDPNLVSAEALQTAADKLLQERAAELLEQESRELAKLAEGLPIARGKGRIVPRDDGGDERAN